MISEKERNFTQQFTQMSDHKIDLWKFQKKILHNLKIEKEHDFTNFIVTFSSTAQPCMIRKEL